MRATNIRKVFVLYAVLSCCAGCGGPEQPPPAASPSTEPSVDTIRAAPNAQQAKPEQAKPAEPAPLRCGDYFTAADAKAIGIEAPGYDENTTQSSPGAGVVCMAGPLTIAVFRGDRLDSMLSGLEAAGDKSGVKLQEGPAIGAASKWTLMGSFTSVMFTATSKGFTGNVSGQDKAVVEKAARALDLKMK